MQLEGLAGGSPGGGIREKAAKAGELKGGTGRQGQAGRVPVCHAKELRLGGKAGGEAGSLLRQK